MSDPKTIRRKVIITVLLILAALTIFTAPTVIFFTGFHGTHLTHAQNLVEISQGLFPLLGLYALTLVFIQVMVGSLMPLWRRMFTAIEKFHRTLGVFALSFALLHAMLLLIGVGLKVCLARTYVAPSQVSFVWIGYTVILLIICTVSTALLMKRPWLQKRWHLIHLLNYAVLLLALIHSLNLGHDLRASTPLRWLWYTYGLLATTALAIRLFKLRQPVLAIPAASTAVATKVDIGAINDFIDGQPRCVQVNDLSIAVFRHGSNFTALADSCSHAGGSLCQGSFDGTTVTCPLHGTQFDTTTGAVIRGPATVPQKTYTVSVMNGRVWLQT
jgi:nitrite reductase/ring-hydroxylating ferredoxin subunit/DMSO/TMAO reductase YedYZ heme-binding membrane subunit